MQSWYAWCMEFWIHCTGQLIAIMSYWRACTWGYAVQLQQMKSWIMSNHWGVHCKYKPPYSRSRLCSWLPVPTRITSNPLHCTETKQKNEGTAQRDYPRIYLLHLYNLLLFCDIYSFTSSVMLCVGQVLFRVQVWQVERFMELLCFLFRKCVALGFCS